MADVKRIKLPALVEQVRADAYAAEGANAHDAAEGLFLLADRLAEPGARYISVLYVAGSELRDFEVVE